VVERMLGREGSESTGGKNHEDLGRAASVGM